MCGLFLSLLSSCYPGELITERFYIYEDTVLSPSYVNSKKDAQLLFYFVPLFLKLSSAGKGPLQPPVEAAVLPLILPFVFDFSQFIAAGI